MRDADIPVSQQPSKITPNYDNRNNVQKGKIYYFDKDGKQDYVRIMDDAAGHYWGVNNPQNRGSKVGWATCCPRV